MEGYTLVTGASSGIGEGCVIALSKDRKVILSGRDSQKLEEVRQKCFLPDQHLIWCCDLANDRMSVFHSLSIFLIDQGITVEAFVHCAGITKILPLRNFLPSYVDEIFNTNVFSAVEMLRVLLKKDNRSALRSIIFISGLWSIRGDVGNSIYAASKGALNSLVCSLAQELAPNIRVNALLLGAIITPMTSQLLLHSKLGEEIQKDYPLGVGNVDDVVNYIQFLLDEKSRWITGQKIVIDGGRSTK